MATWIKIHAKYLNKDAIDSIEPDPQELTYLLAIMRDGEEIKIGPFASSSAATAALTAIIASDTVIGPYA